MIFEGKIRHDTEVSSVGPVQKCEEAKKPSVLSFKCVVYEGYINKQRISIGPSLSAI